MYNYTIYCRSSGMDIIMILFFSILSGYIFCGFMIKKKKNIFDRGIQSNFVVRLIGIVNSYEPIYVVMELMENGDLKSFLMNAAPLSDEVS